MLKQPAFDLVANPEALAASHQFAQAGRFPEILAVCLWGEKLAKLLIRVAIDHLAVNVWRV